MTEGELWDYAAVLTMGGFFLCFLVWFGASLLLGAVHMVKRLIG